MEKGTKVQVNLKVADAKRLGINTIEDIKGEGIVDSEYTNGIAGHYIIMEKGKFLAIPDRLNAVTPIEAKQEHEQAA